jgi:hypothetical protein
VLPNTHVVTKSIAPALVAAAFDALAAVPRSQRLEPALLIAATHHIGGDATHYAALLVRIRGTAIVLRDPRWLPWSAYFKTCGCDAHCLFDAALIHIIASLPLTAELRFHSDDFFDAVLARTGASGHG